MISQALTICSWLIVLDVGVHGYLDVRFDVRLRAPHHECKTFDANGKCKLAYAIGLLQSAPNDYDLRILMLQDAFALERIAAQGLFKEETVANTPKGLTVEQGSHVFLGIRFFGLPGAVQDYHLIDVTTLLTGQSKHVSTRTNTTAGSFGVLVKYGSAAALLHHGDGQLKSCQCGQLTCGCCEHVEVDRIYLNETGCANITYLPKEYGISLTFSLNGVIWYNDTMSVKNPPPVCFDVPYLKEYASLCLRFHDLNVSNHTFSGCIRLEAELYHVRLAERELGCFHMPILSSESSRSFLPTQIEDLQLQPSNKRMRKAQPMQTKHRSLLETLLSRKRIQRIINQKTSVEIDLD